jgi:hypothetical protein
MMRVDRTIPTVAIADEEGQHQLKVAVHQELAS